MVRHATTASAAAVIIIVVVVEADTAAAASDGHGDPANGFARGDGDEVERLRV